VYIIATMERIKTLQGARDILTQLQNRQTEFILVGSYTETAQIDGITAAGLPGFIDYTPALDMELLYYGYPKSMPDIAKMPDGPPSPVLIASAVRSLSPLPLQFIDAGLKIPTKAPITKINSNFSKSITENAQINAEELFNEGKRYAQEISHTSEVFIIGEVVPAGTTTAYAVTKALGYECDGWFASSSAELGVTNLKRKIVDEAIEKHVNKQSTLFDILSCVGDTMQPFVAGLVTTLSQTNTVILGGGTQMAAVLAILKEIQTAKENINFKNTALITTKWIAHDRQSNIATLLCAIDPTLNAFFVDFDFSASDIKNLRLYDEGYVKEGIASGANIAYAYLNGITQEEITSKVEEIYSSFS